MKTRTEAQGVGMERLRGRCSGKVTCCGQDKDDKSRVGPEVWVKMYITCESCHSQVKETQNQIA